MIETRYFTPEEAERTLPLVRKIVRDILETAREMRLLAEEINDDTGNNPVIQKMSENINNFIRELEEIGCYYKDWNFSIGLVDFPSYINGKEVYLCWKSDEEKIGFYHDMDKGFDSRRRLP